jgi:hypothetical protein
MDTRFKASMGVTFKKQNEKNKKQKKKTNQQANKQTKTPLFQKRIPSFV